MAKEWAKPFYNSKAWKAAREAFVAERRNEDGGMCEVCRERLGYIVHHMTELTPENVQDPMIALNADNLLWVCKECHDEFDGHFNGFRGKKQRNCSCLFDDDGQPCPPILK